MDEQRVAAIREIIAKSRNIITTSERDYDRVEALRCASGDLLDALAAREAEVAELRDYLTAEVERNHSAELTRLRAALEATQPLLYDLCVFPPWGVDEREKARRVKELVEAAVAALAAPPPGDGAGE